MTQDSALLPLYDKSRNFGTMQPRTLSQTGTMSLKTLGAATQELLAKGSYVDSGGTRHDIAAQVAQAVSATRCYDPDELSNLLESCRTEPTQPSPPTIELTPETTQAATERLVRSGRADVSLLNFASARNVCGGFRSGARAQEEDIARSSALSVCLGQSKVEKGYYGINRKPKNRSTLYTDRLVYTPQCPFFRVEGETLVPPYYPAIVSAPAPNYGAAVPRHADEDEFQETYRRRAAYALAVMKSHGHKTIVLGAVCSARIRDSQQTHGRASCRRSF